MEAEMFCSSKPLQTVTEEQLKRAQNVKRADAYLFTDAELHINTLKELASNDMRKQK